MPVPSKIQDFFKIDLELCCPTFNLTAMKKSALIIVLGLLPFISFGQKTNEKNVPHAIKDAFHSKYPNVKDVKWEKEEGNYEAGFDVNQVENSVLFSQDGKIIETEIEIKISQLPKNALDYLKEHYKNQKIKEAAKIITHKGVVIYEAEIHGKDILFDEKGTFITRDKV